MNWFIKCMRNYATFSGRAHRAEYWCFTLFFLLFYYVVILLTSLSVGKEHELTAALLYQAAFLIPCIAVTVRRLHDTNRTGWWWLIAFLPPLSLLLLYYLIIEGSNGYNRYGPNPEWEA